MASEPSAHQDRFAALGLPAPEDQPARPRPPWLALPPRLNAAEALLAPHRSARAQAPAVLAPGLTWSYAELEAQVNRLAHVLVGHLGLVPGNRVLLRAPNTPLLAAAYLAIFKAGGIAVGTMPLLRARDLAPILTKGEIALALCDARLTEELERAADLAGRPLRTLTFNTPDATLEPLMARAPTQFAAVETAAEDIALFGFTSGTTGVPKCTMHAHADLIAVCDTYGARVLAAEPSDLFVGSPPLAFTFGLGGLVLFPLRIGAATLLLDRAPPEELAAAIAHSRASVCFTAPTAYRVMAGLADRHDLTSLRIAVSAGEALPRATFETWKAATGLDLMDGIGATEMLHIFIGAPRGRIRPGATGLPVPGYEAKVVDEHGSEVARGIPGRLAVRGPTGCRYLSDERQTTYVQQGWNITGDTYIQDEDGYFWYQARNDDMIVSAGYNIAGPEVEAALLTHPAVAEAGVVAAPDPERGMIVKAYIVPAPGVAADEALAAALQAHVKAEIAPYKYPRAILFVDKLPRTDTGKLQRFALRQRATQEADSTRGGP